MSTPSDHHSPSVRSFSLRSYAAENGWYLALARIAGAVPRRMRAALIARRLHTTGLGIGRIPHIAGLAHMRIGRNLSAGDNLWLEAITHFAGESFNPLLTIGDDCNLSDQVHIACTNRVTIGSGLLSGSRVIITDHTHGLLRASSTGQQASRPHDLRPTARPLSRDGVVVIGRNVWIGDGCAILSGANIGDGAIIGANSVVNSSIPAYTIAVGAPARPIQQWDDATGTWARIHP